jgi:hypothetical protein
LEAVAVLGLDFMAHFLYREVFNQLDAFTALRFTGTGALLAAERMRILPMTQHADNIWNEERSYLCSQITGGVENAVPLQANIPCTGGRDFDLPSENALQENLKFPYECFFSILLLSEGYCCKLCPSNNPRRKSLAPISSNFSSVSTRLLCFVFLSIKNPAVLSLFAKL